MPGADVYIPQTSYLILTTNLQLGNSIPILQMKTLGIEKSNFNPNFNSVPGQIDSLCRGDKLGARGTVGER